MKRTVEMFLGFAGLILAMIVLLLNAVLSYQSIHRLSERDGEIDHSRMILGQLQGVFANVTNAATSQRGYLLTGDEAFLAPFTPARQDAYAGSARLDELIKDPGVRSNLPALGAAIDGAFQNLDQGLELRRGGGRAALDATPQVLRDGKARVDAVRQAVAAVEAAETKLLMQRTAQSEANLKQAATTLAVATGVAMATVALAFWFIRRDERRRLRFAAERTRLADYNRLLVESTGEGIFGLDLEGRCTFLNTAGERMLGVKASEIIGQRMHERTHHHRLDGTEYPASECPIYAAFSTGRGCRVDNESFFRADGTSFPVEYSANPIKDSGKTSGAVVTFVDVTQRRRTEQGMRLRESALRAIAQGVFITDPVRSDEAIEFANEAFERITGYARHEVRGREISFLGGKETDPQALAELNAALIDGLAATVELKLYRKDGSPWWATIAISPVATTTGGRVTHFVGVVTDVTERRLAAEELERAKDDAELAREQSEAANIAKSQFLANMSHELRTPLNAVIMYSELLQEEAEDRNVPTFIPDLDKIRNAGKHLLALVNGVLDLSKIEAGKMELYLESFDVAAMIRDVASTVQPLVDKRQNKLELALAADAGAMYADLTKVRQILFNLLSNASKFTENGTIRVDLTPETDGPSGTPWVNIRVTDSGLGMTPEQLGRLFQPFTQADASTTRKFGGTGLGLAISKHFCEMMGGSIGGESVAGQGSVFTVRLPTRVAKPAAPTAESATNGDVTPAVEGSNVTTVLVIDDEPSVRDLVSRTLAADGIRSITAADGETGLRLAREVHPDLIFLDVLMPQMDGWSVLTAIKSDPQIAGIPVIMLTLVNETEMGYLLGAAEYLHKPIDRDRLAEVVGKYRSTDPADEVLLVEDDDSTRDVVRRSLVRQGWSVAEATNGKMALEQINRRVPALILLDLMMPEMDGFEFLAEFRSNSAWEKVPVVVMTSKDLTAEERQRLSGNVERIVQKGTYSRETLLREVRKIAAQHVRPVVKVQASETPVKDAV